MPNEALLLDLEQTREDYIQKQKAANALLAGMKNLSGALNKASRALQEFGEQNVSLESSALNYGAEGLNSARLSKEQALDVLVPNLRREAKRLALLTGGLRDAVNALNSQPVDVVRLDHAYATLQNNAGQEGLLDDLMPALYQELQLAEKELGSIFGGALRDAMAELGVEVMGQPPRFQLGRFELDANFVTRKATLNYGKTEMAKNIPLSLEAITRAYQRESKSIEGRAEDGEKWIGKLYEAWESARQKGGKSTARANIVKVYYELVLLRQSRAFDVEPSKRSFQDYSRAQFIYDFVEFAQNQQLAVDGKRVEPHIATQSQADSPSRSMWIVTGRGPHDGSYISDIEFK